MTQLPDESLFGDYGEWPGRDVVDSGGERLGGVREIYLDRETGQPEWVLVDVDGGEARFVPLADAAVETSQIRVAHQATTIRNAPGIGAEPRIDQTEERRLYAHYGLGYSEDDSGSGLPTDDPPTAQQQAPAPTGWGTPEPREADRTETPPTDTPSSWSDVAPTDTVDAPPPAEPPSATEIEKADIPEPPAMTDRASEPEPIDSYSTFGEAATTDFDTHSPPDRAAFEPPTTPEPSPFEATTTPEPEPTASVSPSLDQPGIAVPVTPDVVPAAAAPSPPIPPEATTPDPVAPPPPSPASEAPRSTYTPPPRPEPEPSGGPLAIIKSRPGGIAVGVVVAAVLLMIIRKLR